MIWSPADREAIETALQERIGPFLDPAEQLGVMGETDDDACSASFALTGMPDGGELILEARVDRSSEHLSAEDARDLVLDALDLVLLGWLESGRAERFHGGWTTRRFRGHALALRAEKRFPDLDAQADALLAADARTDPAGDT